MSPAEFSLKTNNKLVYIQCASAVFRNIYHVTQCVCASSSSCCFKLLQKHIKTRLGFLHILFACCAGGFQHNCHLHLWKSSVLQVTRCFHRQEVDKRFGSLGGVYFSARRNHNPILSPSHSHTPPRQGESLSTFLLQYSRDLCLLDKMNGVTVYEAAPKAASSDAEPFVAWPSPKRDVHDDALQPVRQSVLSLSDSNPSNATESTYNKRKLSLFIVLVCHLINLHYWITTFLSYSAFSFSNVYNFKCGWKTECKWCFFWGDKGLSSNF